MLEPGTRLSARTPRGIVTIELTAAGLLERYSAAALSLLDRHLHGRVSKNKAALLRAVTGPFSDPDALQEQLDGLTPELALLLSLSEVPDQSLLQREQLIARARTLGADASDADLDSLLVRGLLVAINLERVVTFKEDTELVLPNPYLRALPSTELPALRLRTLTDARILARRAPEPSRLPRLLRALLDFAERSRLRLTKGGWMSASHVGPLSRALSLTDPDTPIPLPLLLDVAVQAGLLGDDDGLLRPDPEQTPVLREPLHAIMNALFACFCRGGVWIDDTGPAEPRELYEGFRSQYRLPDEDVTRTRGLLVMLLLRLKSSEWVPLDALYEQALHADPRLLWWSYQTNWYGYGYRRKATLHSYHHARQASFVRAFFTRTCAIFGLVELGSTTGEFPLAEAPRHEHVPRDWQLEPSPLAVRLTPLGRTLLHNEPPPAEEATITIGPDFEIIAALDEASPQALYRIGQLASRRRGHPADPVARFTLTQAHWIRALQTSELSPADAIALLAGWSRAPIPSNVARALRDWSQSIDQARLLLNFDLCEFSDAATRDAFTAKNEHAEPRGDRFALLPAAAPAPRTTTTIDYTQPPARCLTIHPDGRIDIDPQKRDFLVEAELAPFTEGAPGALQRTLTADSVKKWRSRDICDRLAARGDIPAGLQGLLRGWCGEVSANLDRVHILQLDPEDARLLLQRPEFTRCFVGSLAEGLLIVRDLRSLRPVLKRLNIQPKTTLRST